MKCFGDKAKTFHCKVVLLDEQELIQELQETTGGQDLLDVVFQHLNLIETSYFGLRYIDPSNQTHWLDPNKRLVKQLKGISPFTLYFSVKFYAADPTKLVEEITRYQFFLQIKQDILQGRLPVSTELAAELGSLAVQSELGDYDPRRHSPGYVSEFRFVANQSVALENKIAELHKKLVSYVPSKAELCYLEKVKWLDMYGVDLHPVLGEDSTEYFLGLTPSGIIVLRNKVKVGNYFWPRITKVYFKGRFFMLRVKDKNNGENTYGFETPSKSACKHLWQCCVEHHAFFRLTQAAGNNPQAMVSIGSKLRNSGRTEKDTITDAQTNVRPQTEFARTPSRRYQRRIVEGAQDTPRTEEMDNKPETRTIVSLPGTVTPVSHVYRSTSMTLAPRSDSPRSTRSAPYPSGLQRQPHSVLGNQARREARPSTRGESPRSVKSASAGRAPDGVERVPRRTSSVESQSSADSRSCNRSCSRHRRSRCRSSDGESEASSKCSSSKGHRRHHHHRHHHRRHRHHSDDSSEHHKHRHRRHRHRSNEKPEPQMVESSDQWARVQNGDTNSRSNTATVRDLTNGYMPSGHDDTEADTQVHHHSSRRKYRKHRSPSDSKQKNYPDEIRRHIEFNLQNTEGLSDAQLREIPYTKVETAKTVKIKYGSPKGKRHRSPKRSKSNSSERKSHHDSANSEKEKDEDENKQIDPTDDTTHKRKDTDKEIVRKGELDNKLPNGSIRPCPRSNQASVAQIQPPSESPRQEGRAISPRSSPNRDSSPLKSFQEAGTLQRRRKETNQNSSPPIFGPKPTMANNHNRTPPLNGNGRPTYPNHNSSHNNPDDQNTFKTCNYVTSNYNSTSENSPSQSLHQNPPSEGAFPPLLRDSTLLTQNGSPVYRREPEVEDHQPQREEELNNGFLESNGGGFMSQCPTLLKNATTERGTHFTAVLKPQPSPQSSVTSGISVGSSSVSISTDSSLARSFSRSYHHQSSVNHETASRSLSHDLTPSSTPDSEQHPYYDKLLRTSDIPPSSSPSEPFYMNSDPHSRVHHRATNEEPNFHLDDALTQHSTNILIHYHDANSSGSSSGYKTPTPTPRSSIISSIHCSDASTHIVQSYGPAYANSHIINSLKRSKKSPHLSRPSSSLSYCSSPPATTLRGEATLSTNTNEINTYSSLPRNSLKKPLTKSTGSQTNPKEIRRPSTTEVTRQTNDKYTYKNNFIKSPSTQQFLNGTQTGCKVPQIDLQTDLLYNSDTSLMTKASCSRDSNDLTTGEESLDIRPDTTNISPTNVHWKIYNWDTGRNGETWSNSLCRTHLPQDVCNNQQASTTVAETSEGEYQRSPSYSNKYEEMCNNEITTKNFSYGGQPSANNIRNGFNGINRRYEDNFHLVKQSNRPHSMFNGHEPNQKMNMFNGHEPNQKVNMFNGHEHNQVNMFSGHEPNQVNMFNGHEPNQKVNMFNGHDEFNQKVNMFNGYESNPKMNNVENGKFQPKETRNRKYYSAFEEVKRHFEDHSVDRGYHTIEKTPVGSSVNFRNNYVSQNQKLAKERPNSFSYSQKSKLNGTSLNNEYHPKTFEKFNNPNYENPRIFKPILKSFASEDNLNTQTTVKERSKSTERLENVGTFSNNKNRVRWNLQEKTKNMINLKDDNIYYKPRDYNSLNRVIKPNNIHNVKNDVVYAGKGEIIEIKNNQIINIKSVPQQPSSITFKKDSNSKGFTNKNKSPFLKDEISTEL